MTTVPTSRVGDPVWIDLFTADPDVSIAFYGDLFGWTAERAGEEFGGYITFRKDGKAVAGGMGKTEDGIQGPDQWTVYLRSDDARATAEQAVREGGSIVVPALDVGELGTMAILGDPSGAGIGVWQPGTHRGFEAIGIATGGHWSGHVGVPSWFELQTPHYDKALIFYTDVFGWRDPFRVAVPGAGDIGYTTIHSETPMLGGVMDAHAFLPPDSPGGWRLYFGADDVDQAVRRVVELGGSVIAPVMDTPFGQMAGVADPTGAHFSIGGNAS
ncbi:VOC family protein [Nocardia otitidiscaviarum]|uniref:VOC family protein n=1 Tax=Nocardia otitidiscaviarum TaxID=1823 RepID=UPI00189523F5|nr:VOC family protein [Nocardia otitidiscaviarum]MBF6240342.1 VOC family protein [Nocardia otitidiscaviarum]